MDVKEKLAKLLSDVQYLGGLEEKVADHLIANGVTFADRLEQKQATSDAKQATSDWISVEERLPKGANGEIAEDVIAFLNNGETAKVCTGWLTGKTWWLIVGDEDTHTAWGLGDVTHWMPLPSTEDIK